MLDAVAEVVDVDALAVGAVELVPLARPGGLAAAHARLLRPRARVAAVRRVVLEPGEGRNCCEVWRIFREVPQCSQCGSNAGLFNLQASL